MPKRKNPERDYDPQFIILKEHFFEINKKLEQNSKDMQDVEERLRKIEVVIFNGLSKRTGKIEDAMSDLSKSFRALQGRLVWGLLAIIVIEVLVTILTRFL